jgi:hypothetical protein
MSSATRVGSGSRAAEEATPTADRARLFSRLAVAGIGCSLLIMVAASSVRDSWMYPRIILPAVGPPWDLTFVHMTAGVATVVIWLAIVLGVGGVVAGVAAVERGARPSVRVLLIAAAVAVALLTVLPPAGSTDVFDYASYGRIAVLGHSPYVMTPAQLARLHNTFSQSVPSTWSHVVSVYGPLATLEQFLAAKLGGLSAARITFWLKLWNAIAFGLVAFVADRALRSDPARRLRAHLLWTINPLLLWNLIAEGHVDLIAAAAGLLGLLVLGQHSNTARPPLLRVLAAGALIGAAADVKINYVLFGLGLAWVLRRSFAALAIAAAGALVVLVPGYAWFGMPAVHAPFARSDGASVDSFYRVFLGSWFQPHLAEIAAVLGIAVAVLAYRRMPAGDQGRPVIRAALVLSVAWLFFWPYQFAWYDVMLICLLMFYPASRLDWLVLGRIAIGNLPSTPGNPFGPPGHVLYLVHHFVVFAIGPLGLFAAAVGLVWLCLSGRWKPPERGDPDPPGSAPTEPELVPSAVGLPTLLLRSAAAISDILPMTHSEGAAERDSEGGMGRRVGGGGSRLSLRSRRMSGSGSGRDRSPAARSR